jgi:hypothetical protein
MRQKSVSEKQPATEVVKKIRRAPLRPFPYSYGLGLYNYEKIDTIIGSGTVRRR